MNHRLRAAALACAVAAAAPAALLGQQGAAAAVAIRVGTLIDGTGATPVRNAVILVRGDRIEAVGPAVRVPAGARVVDLSAYTVLPGFIDAHVHLASRPIGVGDWVHRGITDDEGDDALWGAANARATLLAGFTTVRDVGSASFANVAVARAIEAGRIPGPRVLAAGHLIGISGGHCDQNGLAAGATAERGPLEGIAAGVDEVREAVRLQVKYGAAVIKICATGGVLSQGDEIGAQQMTEDEMRAAVETARMLGRRVAAHAHGNEGIKAAIRAGVTSIEHGSFLDDEAVHLMVEHGTWLVPTLFAGWSVGTPEAAAAAHLPPWAAAKGRQAWAALQQSIRLAVAGGVKIALGTDAGVDPHGQNAREFELLVTAGGMTPMQAIQAGTMNGATLLGMEHDAGSLEAGKFADLVAVRGDPLADITVLQHPVFVMKGGDVYLSPTP
ncbi:MAG TPA: amidohydrolase family protein [Gemmatimonadales bacterium]|nr:amidohydrolase family protein [Gemmatimonadales bacterium]